MVTPIVQLLLSGYAHRNMIPAHNARIQRLGKVKWLEVISLSYIINFK